MEWRTSSCSERSETMLAVVLIGISSFTFILYGERLADPSSLGRVRLQLKSLGAAKTRVK